MSLNIASWQQFGTALITLAIADGAIKLAQIHVCVIYST